MKRPPTHGPIQIHGSISAGRRRRTASQSGSPLGEGKLARRLEYPTDDLRGAIARHRMQNRRPPSPAVARRLSAPFGQKEPAKRPGITARLSANEPDQRAKDRGSPVELRVRHRAVPASAKWGERFGDSVSGHSERSSEDKDVSEISRR